MYCGTLSAAVGKPPGSANAVSAVSTADSPAAAAVPIGHWEAAATIAAARLCGKLESASFEGDRPLHVSRRVGAAATEPGCAHARPARFSWARAKVAQL